MSWSGRVYENPLELPVECRKAMGVSRGVADRYRTCIDIFRGRMANTAGLAALLRSIVPNPEVISTS